MFYIIHGEKYSLLNDIPNLQLRTYFQDRMANHSAFSYRGDWYARFGDLDNHGKQAVSTAKQMIMESGVDIRSIPKADPLFLAIYGTKAQHRLIFCAFNSIREDGKLDCDMAARQFARRTLGLENAPPQPVSFLRKLMEIRDEINESRRLTVQSIDGIQYSVEEQFGGEPASVRWDGTPLFGGNEVETVKAEGNGEGAFGEWMNVQRRHADGSPPNEPLY